MKKLFLLPVIMLLAAGACAQNVGWWDSNWNNRSIIMINEISGKDLVDFQVHVTLDADGIDYQASLPEGDDLRFIDPGTGNKLPYWIDKWDDISQSASIWVKVPKVSANGVALVYMYYNNPSAESASNGHKTFDFFEDFEAGDLNGWAAGCDQWDAGHDIECLQGIDSGSNRPDKNELVLSGKASCLSPPFDGVRPYIKKDINLDAGKYVLEMDQRGLGGQYDFCSRGIFGDSYSYVDSVAVLNGSACKYDGCSQCNTGWTSNTSESFSGGRRTLKISAYISDCEAGKAWFDVVRIRKYSVKDPVVSVKKDLIEPKDAPKDGSDELLMIGAIAALVIVLLLILVASLFIYRSIVYRKPPEKGIECPRCGMALPKGTKNCPVCGGGVK